MYLLLILFIFLSSTLNQTHYLWWLKATAETMNRIYTLGSTHLSFLPTQTMLGPRPAASHYIFPTPLDILTIYIKINNLIYLCLERDAAETACFRSPKGYFYPQFFKLLEPFVYTWKLEPKFWCFFCQEGV